MRRFRQQLPQEEVRQILASATSGVVSLVDAGGQPYGVPLSFVFDGGRSIYFHCAREGRKTDCMRHSDRASFCVVAQDDILPEKFTTCYRSVIAEGRLAAVESREEVAAALRMLCSKYSPGIDCEAEIAKGIEHVSVLRLDIATATGKEAIELTRKR